MRVKKLKVVEADPENCSLEETCTICCSEMTEGDKIYKLHCGHTFHQACIDPWLKKSSECPNCRGDVYAKPTFNKREILNQQSRSMIKQLRMRRNTSQRQQVANWVIREVSYI